MKEMMDCLLRLFNMSVTASWLILAILVIRPFLRKSPKWIRGILWGLVGVRLIIPISFESAWSLIPSKELIVPNAVDGTALTFASGIRTVDVSVNTYLQQHASVESIAAARDAVPLEEVLVSVWLLGVAVLVLYSVISYWRLHRHVADAVKYHDNIYQSDKISSPFVLGFVKPGIYVPFRLEGEALQCVIAHEQAHIRRKDYWIKPFGYALAAVYWFNPLIWAAYYYLCQDIELACDEKVIRKLGFDKKKMYSQTLLECSMERHFVRACPIAFGEIGVGKRVKNILEMKKTKVGIVIAALLVCVVVAVCFMSNPKSEKNDVAAKDNVAANAGQDNSGEQLTQEESDAQKAVGEAKPAAEKDEKEAALAGEKTQEAATQEVALPEKEGENARKQQEEPEREAAEKATEGNASCELKEDVSVEQFGFPFADGVDCTITGMFGTWETVMHEGMDFAAWEGTEVLSCTGGTIKETGFDEADGNYVMVEGDDGYTCYYKHLKDVCVENGDRITLGTVIGTVGNTGNSTGPHLHLGIQNPAGEWIDPVSVLGL